MDIPAGMSPASISSQFPEHIKLHTKAVIGYCVTPELIFEMMPIMLLMDGAPAISQMPCLMKALDKAITVK